MLVSTASGDSVEISKKVKLNDPAYDTALSIKLAGLKGGHSGVEIDKGRMNGLVGLVAFLKELEKSNVDFELADLSGGTASNAIPTGAECTIVVKRSDKAIVEDLAAKYLEQQKKKYAGIDDGMTLEVTEADALPKVIGKEEKANIIQFIGEIIDGVHTMSKDTEGLVESSANLGVFSLKGNEISGESTIRSSSPEREEEILQSHKALAEKCGFEVKTIVMAHPWPYNPDSKLLKFAKEVYKEQNGEDIIVAAVHGGLECGTFAKKNPKMDMISIGPDLVDVHTVNETLYIESIPKVWNLLEGILMKVGEQ